MVSICIIVKNEEKNLKECLKRLCKFGYEIVVVDTGSTDDTKKIAGEYTDKVFDFEWCDDFGAARNYAISKASNEFVFMVDSDEFLTKLDKQKFEKLLLQHPKEVGRIHRNNVFVRDEIGFNSSELVNRVFSKIYYHYTGRIHEQVEALAGVDYVTYPVPAYFDHSGYDGDIEDRKKKADRNISLLEQVLKEDGDDPYILYQLGKGYYMRQDYAVAAEYLGKALEFDLNPELEYVIDLVETYGYALINSNQNHKALLMENIYDAFSGSADFVFLMGYIYMQNAMFERAVEEFLKATEYKASKMEGVNSYIAFYNTGVIYECLGDKKKALYYYRKCGGYEPAKQGAMRCR